MLEEAEHALAVLQEDQRSSESQHELQLLDEKQLSHQGRNLQTASLLHL